MTPADLTTARKALGMTAAALGRALEMEGRDPGRYIRAWEQGAHPIPGPARVAVRYMLAEAARASRIVQEAENRPPLDQVPGSRSEALYEALTGPDAGAVLKATRRRG